MQSETYRDGSEYHELLQALNDEAMQEEAKKYYNKAMDRRFHKLKSIKQTFNIGRNDPCPCGSGRKFKKCHLGLEIPKRPTEE
ncbi:MAG: SEC-C metal-binding domain-containing protein [Planctomycetota bacterium]